MNSEEFCGYLEQVTSEVNELVVGTAAAEYASDVNLTSSFDAHCEWYGHVPVLWQASDKILRFHRRGNRKDLIKAIAWLVLGLYWLDKKNIPGKEVGSAYNTESLAVCSGQEES